MFGGGVPQPRDGDGRAVSTRSLNVTGDAIEGTVERRIEGVPAGDQTPQAAKGARGKG